MENITTNPEVEELSESMQILEEQTQSDYKYGFTSDIEMETLPKGLNEDIVRAISAKKNEPEFLLEYRLKAFRHWLTLEEPQWPNVDYPPVDYQDIIYYAAPKKKPKLNSLDEADPELIKTFEKLGIPLDEQKVLAGVVACLLYTSPSPRDATLSRMPSSA